MALVLVLTLQFIVYVFSVSRFLAHCFYCTYLLTSA